MVIKNMKFGDRFKNNSLVGDFENSEFGKDCEKNTLISNNNSKKENLFKKISIFLIKYLIFPIVAIIIASIIF